jgi:hypothetical protein
MIARHAATTRKRTGKSSAQRAHHVDVFKNKNRDFLSGSLRRHSLSLVPGTEERMQDIPIGPMLDAGIRYPDTDLRRWLSEPAGCFPPEAIASRALAADHFPLSNWWEARQSVYTHAMKKSAWSSAQTEQLRILVRDGVSPARASVIFSRTRESVRQHAARSGFPFPNDRDTRKAQRKREDQIRAELGLDALRRT